MDCRLFVLKDSFFFLFLFNIDVFMQSLKKGLLYDM